VLNSSGLGRPFWLLWAAFTASNIADGLVVAAFPLLANELTDDARLIAMVVVFQYLPFLVVGLPAGLVIDRFDRRRVAAVAQAVRAAVVAGLGLAVIGGGGSIALLCAVAMLVGATEVLVDGGLPAIVRQLVPARSLEVANSRMMATQRVSNAFIGPPVGAALFVLAPSTPFLLAGGGAAVGVALMARLPGGYRPAQSEDAVPVLRRMVVGLRYVLGHDVLRPLVVSVGIFSFVGAAGNAVFVVLATERFGIGGVGFGLLISVGAVASVVMAFFVAPVVTRRSHSFSMRVAIVTFVVGSLMFGLFDAPEVAFLAAVVVGLSDPSWNIVSSTVRQRLVPDEVFGRVMTAYLFVAWGARPVGALVGGIVAQRFGVEWVPLASAVVVGSLLVTARSMFRRIDDAVGHP
jgi:MFS family permease